MAAPITTIRIDPKTIDQLKKVTGKTEKAAAIREAIHDKINSDNSHALHALHGNVHDLVTVQVARKLLKKKSDSTIRRMLYKKKLRGYQAKKGGHWLVFLDSIKALQVPNVVLK